ncbi:hypothetical protein FGO68_gene5090 [Halteria grandinella]|uniref:Uncharacterized protein n=1 Tax=Halteria grandinella TaxID=5974 RepID=A0A8J8NHY2_HALGN|nr:hypothetical protein FGO68_gene5090 [Halteria grandinella]
MNQLARILLGLLSLIALAYAGKLRVTCTNNNQCAAGQCCALVSYTYISYLQGSATSQIGNYPVTSPFNYEYLSCVPTTSQVVNALEKRSVVPDSSPTTVFYAYNEFSASHIRCLGNNFTYVQTNDS